MHAWQPSRLPARRRRPRFLPDRAADVPSSAVCQAVAAARVRASRPASPSRLAPACRRGPGRPDVEGRLDGDRGQSLTAATRAHGSAPGAGRSRRPRAEHRWTHRPRRRGGEHVSTRKRRVFADGSTDAPSTLAAPTRPCAAHHHARAAGFRGRCAPGLLAPQASASPRFHGFFVPQAHAAPPAHSCSRRCPAPWARAPGSSPRVPAPRASATDAAQGCSCRMLLLRLAPCAAGTWT